MHERALTQVVTAVLAESFGQSGHSHRPWSKSDSHVKVKIKGSRQGQEIPFTQTRIKDRSEINVHWATEPVASTGQSERDVHRRMYA